MTWGVRACLAAIALLAAPGCDRKPHGTSSAPAPRSTVPPDVKVAPVPSVAITLLDPGAEPRRTLRLRPAAGAAASVQILARVKHDERGQESTYAERIRLEMKVVEVTTGGDFRYLYKVRSMDAIEGGSASKEEDLTGASGEVTVNALGVELHSKSIPLQDIPLHFTILLLDAIEQVVSDLIPVLPAEPVGIGARWEVARPLKEDEGRTTKPRYIVEKLAGSQASLRIELSERKTGGRMGGSMGFPNQGVGDRYELHWTNTEKGAPLEIDLDRIPIAAGKRRAYSEQEYTFTSRLEGPRLVHAKKTLETEVLIEEQ